MEFFDLLDTNHGIFINMKELAYKQKNLIMEDRINDFLSLSLKREELQRKISQNNRRFEKINRGIKAKKTAGKHEEMIKKIELLINDIQEIDVSIEETLSDKKKDLLYSIKNFIHYFG